MLLSFIKKTVKKTICSEHESYQMVEDMATPMVLALFIAKVGWHLHDAAYAAPEKSAGWDFAARGLRGCSKHRWGFETRMKH